MDCLHLQKLNIKTTRIVRDVMSPVIAMPTIIPVESDREWWACEEHKDVVKDCVGDNMQGLVVLVMILLLNLDLVTTV